MLPSKLTAETQCHNVNNVYNLQGFFKEKVVEMKLIEHGEAYSPACLFGGMLLKWLILLTLL